MLDNLNREGFSILEAEILRTAERGFAEQFLRFLLISRIRNFKLPRKLKKQLGEMSAIKLADLYKKLLRSAERKIMLRASCVSVQLPGPNPVVKFMSAM